MLAIVHRSPRAVAAAASVAAALVVVGILLLLFRPAAAAPVIAAVEPSPSPPSASAAPLASPSPSPSPLPSPTPTPLLAGIADLTGVHVPDGLAHRLPIAVLIDDNRIARPQSGFNGAANVYQAPADGGETRYMLVFQEGESRDVGPVRSGR
ncbi:MAG: hypothetical protein QOF49_2315, partial [Chloroflexota bacterium]|nr:hypothetical protein [Chloroflexota bacterium]